MTTLTTEAGTRIDRFRALTKGVEGWINPLSVRIWDVMLGWQAQEGSPGDMLEVGVWHGRTAALLALHANAGERIHLVDFNRHEPLDDNLDRFRDHCAGTIELTIADSFTFFNDAFMSEHRRRLRWIHIDGSHEASGLHSDLLHAESLLAKNGVLVVDDFMNPMFPQVSEVTFEFMHQRRHELSLTLNGANKAYIVRPLHHKTILRRIESGAFEREIAALGMEIELRKGTHLDRPVYGVRPSK
ncbi:MAG: class I SAM-dependent methyltransferase [Phycisphaeraceae bacterium]|nr:MAG: class I SAM-dependent methyltransferase [Phycisphaeraceae bacterium]